ncbi:MAG: ImmA/IrrE family metallo-endopeptidase [Chloroflexota bacterium]
MRPLAVEMARRVHRQHPRLRFPLDMDALAAAQGCICVDWPFLDPVREVKHLRWIGIAQWLDGRERRRHVAHALGHHLMHAGNQLSFRHWQKVTQLKQERQAEQFAAHLLMPEEELSRVRRLPVWELAEYFGVPEDLVWHRLTRFATEDELARWQMDEAD